MNCNCSCSSSENQQNLYGYNSLPVVKQTTNTSITCLKNAVEKHKDTLPNCLAACRSANGTICKGSEGESIPDDYCSEVCIGTSDNGGESNGGNNESDTKNSLQIFNECSKGNIQGQCMPSNILSCAIPKCNNNQKCIDDINNFSYDFCTNNIIDTDKSLEIFNKCTKGNIQGQCNASNILSCAIPKCNNNQKCIDDINNFSYDFCSYNRPEPGPRPVPGPGPGPGPKPGPGPIPIPTSWNKEYYDIVLKSISNGDVPQYISECVLNNIAKQYPNPQVLEEMSHYDSLNLINNLMSQCNSKQITDPGKPNFDKNNNKELFQNTTIGKLVIGGLMILILIILIILVYYLTKPKR
jgi:hypothetical protein